MKSAYSNQFPTCLPKVSDENHGASSPESRFCGKQRDWFVVIHLLSLFPKENKSSVYRRSYRTVSNLKWTKTSTVQRLAVACKGHAISWSVSLLRVYKLDILSFKIKISSLQTRNFKFTNSKFRVYKHEISSLQTRSFEFTNSKFEFKTRSSFKFVNSKYFEFVNSKFRV